jgi:hypothetical protein
MGLPRLERDRRVGWIGELAIEIECSLPLNLDLPRRDQTLDSRPMITGQS